MDPMTILLLVVIGASLIRLAWGLNHDYDKESQRRAAVSSQRETKGGGLSESRGRRTKGHWLGYIDLKSGPGRLFVVLWAIWGLFVFYSLVWGFTGNRRSGALFYWEWFMDRDWPGDHPIRWIVLHAALAGLPYAALRAGRWVYAGFNPPANED